MKRTRLLMIPFAGLALVCLLVAGEQTFPVRPGGSLDVDMEAGGSIEVNGLSTNQVDVKWAIVGRDTDNVRVTADSAGDRVRVSSVYIEKGKQTNGGVNLRVSVPNRFDLNVRTRGGHVTITNVDGNISGETMGGHLVLAGLKGSLRMSTKGGNISLSECDVDGKVSTMGGNVSLDNLVQRGAHSINRIVEVSTMGGNIEIANAPLGAKVETKGGNIVIKKAAEFIDAKTLGGNIAVNEHSGNLVAHTLGGNITATIVPGGSDQGIDISSMGGRIDLTLPSVYSGTFDLELAYTRKTSKKYRIISDFPIHQKETPEWDSGRADARKYITANGTVGSGVNKVKVRTVNGDIVIKRK